HGRQLEHLDRLRREPRETLVDDLAHGRRDAELARDACETHAERCRLYGAGADELAPELGDEKRVAARQLLDRGDEPGARLDTRGEPDELRDLALGEAVEP